MPRARRGRGVVALRLVENPTMTDFQIADHGSIISIKPVSEAARTWVDENVVSEPWQWLGGALCVDTRCARDLINELAAEGFEISL